MDHTATQATGGRPVTSLIGLLLIPLFIGLLIAPHVYNAMWTAGRDSAFGASYPGLAEFCREAELEKVANRCVSLVALVLLVPMIRRSGLGPRIRDALRLRDGRWRDLVRACAMGAVSMAALYVAGLSLGYYKPPSDSVAGTEFLAKFLPFLSGAVFVGVFEEIFFRGFVYGALRSRLSLWPSVLLSSAFFGIIHFFRPKPPLPVEHATWTSAFELLPHLLGRFSLAADWPFLTTLFVMGITLSILYERRQHLWYAIGLHGGWVFAMQMGKHMLAMNRENPSWWFGNSDIIAKGPIAIVVILCFLFWSLTVSRAEPRKI